MPFLFGKLSFFAAKSGNLPQLLCAPCLSICLSPVFERGQKSANFNMTLNLAGKEFVFICLQVLAEEWQGVTPKNNVCGDYLPAQQPFKTQNSKIIQNSL